MNIFERMNLLKKVNEVEDTIYVSAYDIARPVGMKNSKASVKNQRLSTISSNLDMSEACREEISENTLNGNTRKNALIKSIKENGFDVCRSSKLGLITEGLYACAFVEKYAFHPQYDKILSIVNSNELTIRAKAKMLNEIFDDNILLHGNTRYCVLMDSEMEIKPDMFYLLDDRILGFENIKYNKLVEDLKERIALNVDANRALRLLIMILIIYYNQDERTQHILETNNFMREAIDLYFELELDFLKEVEHNMLYKIKSSFEGDKGFSKKDGPKSLIQAYVYDEVRLSNSFELSDVSTIANFTYDVSCTRLKSQESANTVTNIIASMGINPFTLKVENCDKLHEVANLLKVLKGGSDVCNVAKAVCKEFKKTNNFDVLEILSNLKEDDIKDVCNIKLSKVWDKMAKEVARFIVEHDFRLEDFIIKVAQYEKELLKEEE